MAIPTAPSPWVKDKCQIGKCGSRPDSACLTSPSCDWYLCRWTAGGSNRQRLPVPWVVISLLVCPLYPVEVKRQAVQWDFIHIRTSKVCEGHSVPAISTSHISIPWAGCFLVTFLLSIWDKEGVGDNIDNTDGEAHSCKRCLRRDLKYQLVIPLKAFEQGAPRRRWRKSQNLHSSLPAHQGISHSQKTVFHHVTGWATPREVKCFPVSFLIFNVASFVYLEQRGMLWQLCCSRSWLWLLQVLAWPLWCSASGDSCGYMEVMGAHTELLLMNMCISSSLLPHISSHHT